MDFNVQSMEMKSSGHELQYVVICSRIERFIGANGL